MLRKIAHQIELKSWQRLADHLLISPVRQDAFREKFKSLPNRVYHMLSYWSMIQPFGTDKVDGLASALYDVKLGYVAQTLLYRGNYMWTVMHTFNNIQILYICECFVTRN